MPKSSVGEKHMTKQGDEIEIVGYDDPKHVTIKFKEGHTLIVRMHDIKRSFIMNPLHPMTYGAGYLGVGKYKTKVDKKSTPYYKLWNKVLERCYSERFQITNPTYIGCSVSAEWKCFQNFARWYEENYKSHMKRWELDKDILFKGNKIYSPETCCFVPKRINQLFIKPSIKRDGLPRGVCRVGNKFHVYMGSKYLRSFPIVEEAFECYKLHKEECIKEVADEWKDRIELKVYTAMYNYKIEITD